MLPVYYMYEWKCGSHNKKVLSLIPLAVTPGAIVPTSNFLGRQVEGGPAGGGGQVRHQQDKWLSVR